MRPLIAPGAGRDLVDRMGKNSDRRWNKVQRKQSASGTGPSINAQAGPSSERMSVEPSGLPAPQSTFANRFAAIQEVSEDLGISEEEPGEGGEAEDTEGNVPMSGPTFA